MVLKVIPTIKHSAQGTGPLWGDKHLTKLFFLETTDGQAYTFSLTNKP